MAIDTGSEVENIVATLLQVGERVVEVSRQQVMTRIWDRKGSPLSKFKEYYEGKSLAEVRNDSTIANCRKLVEEAFVTGRKNYFEYLSYNNDVDKPLTFSLRVLNCHPSKDFVFLVIENITTGKETMLVEDKWKMALDASELGVWDVNLIAKTIFFSRKWEELFGYNTKEIVHMNDWSEKVFPADRAIAEQKMQDYLTGKTPFYAAELRYRCKDGAYKWILSRGVVTERNQDGTPRRFIGIHADISMRKNAEQELLEAKELFANFFHFSGAGKVLIAPGGRWLEVNDFICNLTGYTKQELEGLHYRDITFHEDFEIDTELIKKLLSKEINSYTIEKRYVAKDRRVLTTEITVTLVWDRDGMPKYYICDIIDRTARKEISDALARRNHELETTAENLHSKINQLEELNHIIAHNLRGPAGNIKLLSENSDVFPEKEAMQMIHTSSLSLLENLNMMVEVARIRLDKEVNYDLCNVPALVDNITLQLQGVIVKNQIRIELDAEVKEIAYPRLYLDSILYNMVSNAIKYRRTDIPSVIRIATRAVNHRVQIIVKDNGLGIDLEKYGNKIFKLNQIFHEGFDSKGVGLYITKTQIESLGGTIEVQSKPNEGCCFTINL